nr:tripartite tricarboxylate transporter substrate binding protein [Pseudomonas sp.]
MKGDDSMRTLVRFLTACSVVLAPYAAHADQGKPIHVIVPYSAGGLIDTMTRIVASEVSTILDTPVVIENKPGANANIGAAVVARAAPDGLTLLASSSYFTTNPLVEEKLTWERAHFTPVARFALSPSLVVVGRDSPYKSLQALLDAAKGNTRITAGEAGPGASQTMVKDLLQDAASVRFVSVRYAAGGTSYVSDLVNGTVDLGVIPMNVGLGLAQGGKVHALAITSDMRSEYLPDTPTLTEAGVPDASISSWVGFHAPAGTPPETIKRIADAVEKACHEAAVRTRMQTAGAQEAYLGTKAFDDFLETDQARGKRFAQLRLKFAADAQ